MRSVTAKLTAQVRTAGFEVVRVEQPRTNRWVVTARSGTGESVLIMAQDRPLIGAADVQDLAELLRCGRHRRGLLLALGGGFSPEARRTAGELSRRPIELCTSLPAPDDPQPVRTTARAMS